MYLSVPAASNIGLRQRDLNHGSKQPRRERAARLAPVFSGHHRLSEIQQQPDEECLYTLLHAPQEGHDRILDQFVTPIVASIDSAVEVDSYFVARYSEPEWQLRFRVLGRPAFVQQQLRPAIDAALPALYSAGLVRHHEFARYEREWKRYGGPAGMRLCERFFRYDTAYCLFLVSLDLSAGLPKSRREISLLFTERVLDLFDVAREHRADFYYFAHSWTLQNGDWTETELGALDRKFHAIEPALRQVVASLRAGDPTVWGSALVHERAEQALASLAPLAGALTAAHRRGELESTLSSIIWSLTHMHCNRLGIDAHAEAILRYFAWRLYDEPSSTAPRTNP